MTSAISKSRGAQYTPVHIKHQQPAASSQPAGPQLPPAASCGTNCIGSYHRCSSSSSSGSWVRSMSYASCCLLHPGAHHDSRLGLAHCNGSGDRQSALGLHWQCLAHSWLYHLAGGYHRCRSNNHAHLGLYHANLGLHGHPHLHATHRCRPPSDEVDVRGTAGP